MSFLAQIFHNVRAVEFAARLAAVAELAFGRQTRAAARNCGRIRRWLGCRIIPGGGGFAMSEVILRTGLLGAEGSPSGSLVQIPGAVCFHSTMLFGFMINEYE